MSDTLLCSCYRVCVCARVQCAAAVLELLPVGYGTLYSVTRPSQNDMCSTHGAFQCLPHAPHGQHLITNTPRISVRRSTSLYHPIRGSSYPALANSVMLVSKSLRDVLPSSSDSPVLLLPSLPDLRFFLGFLAQRWLARGTVQAWAHTEARYGQICSKAQHEDALIRYSTYT